VEKDAISPYNLLHSRCLRQPNVRAIWTRTQGFTFAELDAQVHRYAQWLLSQGIGPGDLVAMYLQNSAEFVMLMFATHCIGAGPAFVNYNLEGNALMHCLTVAESKLLIVDPEQGCRRRIEASREDIEAGGAKILVLDEALKQEISSIEAVEPPEELRKGMKGSWPYCLIYTSGTTGMPKGCPFTVSRTWLLGTHVEPPFGAKAGEDCWYSPMPLYHGTGIITTTTALLSGVGVAIAPRFSVSNFWPDICESGATRFIYVGETARYLLAAPPHPLERKHKLKLAYGNGLRPDIWTKFQERFNIPEVAEFFNSSEGMFSLVVWSRNGYTAGCVGHHGLIMRNMLHNIYIPVLIDHKSGDIWRDPSTGFAKRMPYEEGGEIIVKVPTREAFGGYWKNPSATEKRFATDVFVKGDLYYRCGDALKRSRDGHWYFLDRLGDTFRWKSENVSTAEVAETLGRYPGIAEANVYGVLIPEHEGRAGCAALQLAPGTNLSDLDLPHLLDFCQTRLPRYAVPLFLRIQAKSSHIHNHKQNKVGLRTEGVDPGLLGTKETGGKEDVILWLKPGAKAYEGFGKGEWEDLAGGKVRL
jgi:acyl-CoA synthetase (AMP-forming)/AMP-acid ligase II